MTRKRDSIQRRLERRLTSTADRMLLYGMALSPQARTCPDISMSKLKIILTLHCIFLQKTAHSIYYTSAKSLEYKNNLLKQTHTYRNYFEYSQRIPLKETLHAGNLLKGT